MTEVFIYSLAFLLALFLIVRRPIARKFGIAIQWELSAGAVIIIAFCFFITTEYVIPRMLERDLVKQPCGSESPQGVCYNLTRSVCETAWQSAETSCKAEFSEVSKSRPTALIGPGMNRCRARRMDQTLHMNRIRESSAYCRAYFDYIDQK